LIHKTHEKGEQPSSLAFVLSPPPPYFPRTEKGTVHAYQHLFSDTLHAFIYAFHLSTLLSLPCHVYSSCILNIWVKYFKIQINEFSYL